MILDIQRGKQLTVAFGWVDFVIDNTDIMAALSEGPMTVKRVSPGMYKGRVFGMRLRIEHLQRVLTDGRTYVRTLSDVGIPMGLGRTYTTAHHKYVAIDECTTSLDLQFRLETSGLSSIYLWLRKKKILAYVDRVCSDIEQAAQMLAYRDSKTETLLDDEQQDRVTQYRAIQATTDSLPASKAPETEASLRLSLVQDTVLVEAEARMSDEQLLMADQEIGDHQTVYDSFMESAKQLACLNNPAFAVRGEAAAALPDVDFRETAFEFGTALYKKYFSGSLDRVLPIIFHQRESAIINLDIDEDLDGLPWEALNDGKDFLALTTRLVRTLGPAHQLSGKSFENTGDHAILLVGSDPHGDLPGARAEVESIAAELSKCGGIAAEVLVGSEANRRRVLDLLGTGKFDVLHYSGHSVFDPEHPLQSYLQLEQGTKLRLHELDQLNRSTGSAKPVDLVFLNSCQSGRVALDAATGRNLSMCRVLRESGVDNVVGMLWNVSDDAAAQVAIIFYKLLMRGERTDIAEAMRRTRCQMALDRAWADGSWLSPVLYG
jgi:CHAT domain